MNPYETQSSTPMSNLPQTYNQTNDNPLSPKGRFTRLSYLAWNGVLGLIFSLAFFLFIILGLGGVALASNSGNSPFSHPLVIFALFGFFCTYVIFFVALICILIRRLHDLNKSGWMWLIMFIPLVSLFFAIYVCVAKGSKNANNYGEFRPTEQTERYIGIAYAIFLSIFMSLYLVIMAFFIASPELFKNAILNSESAIISSGTEHTMSDEEQNELIEENAQLQEELEHNANEINSENEHVAEEAEVTAEEAQNAADEAVKAAEAAAKAATGEEVNQH